MGAGAGARLALPRAARCALLRRAPWSGLRAWLGRPRERCAAVGSAGAALATHQPGDASRAHSAAPWRPPPIHRSPPAAPLPLRLPPARPPADFVQPESRRNEVLGWVRQGVRDFSISRAAVAWGIPVPRDPKQTVYVWFDALNGYLSGAWCTSGCLLASVWVSVWFDTLNKHLSAACAACLLLLCLVLPGRPAARGLSRAQPAGAALPPPRAIPHHATPVHARPPLHPPPAQACCRRARGPRAWPPRAGPPACT